MLLLTLQHIKTNTPELIDIWVVYFGKKSYFGRGHRIVIGQEELKLEYSSWVFVSSGRHRREYRLTFVRRLRRTMDLDIEVSQVVFMGDGADSWDPKYINMSVRLQCQG